MSERLFGTDGVRGRAGEGWLSEDKAALLARAIGSCLLEGGGPARALIGHDGRRSGPGLERAIAHGLRDAGVEAVSIGLTTTPGLALCTRSGDFGLGLMISASHNPAEDNGIKAFDREGGKLPDELEDRIEAALADASPLGGEPADVPVDAALERSYVDHLVAAAEGLSLEGTRIALDCAHGGGSHVAPRVFEALGAEVIGIANAPDGSNINLDCGSTRPEVLCRAVVEHGAHLGVALDGDGDRCLLVDETGVLVDGDALMALLAFDMQSRGRLAHERIVATVMSNKGLHKALAERGIGVTTVGVGDRRVVEALRAEGLSLGGEQSGHIVFGSENHFIGDGTLTALAALRALRASGGPLSRLAAVVEPFPQVLINTAVGSKPPFDQLPEVTAEVQRIERELGDDGRVLLRYSGTEPLARVMIEGPDEAWIQSQAEALAALISERLGS